MEKEKKGRGGREEERRRRRKRRALTLMAQLFSMEGWPEVVANVDGVSTAGESTFIYFSFLIGNCLLLNMFVAIVVIGFGDAARVIKQAQARKEAEEAIQKNKEDERRARMERQAAEDESIERQVPDRVCGLFSGTKRNPTVRYYTGVLVTSSTFENVMLCAILTSCVLLAIERYPPIVGEREEMRG